MEIKAITDPSFRRYGTLLEGYDFAPLLQEMKYTPAPADQCIYQPSLGELENLSAKQVFRRASHSDRFLQWYQPPAQCTGISPKF